MRWFRVRIPVSRRFDFVVLPFAKVELNRNCVKIINVLGPSFIDMFVVSVMI